MGAPQFRISDLAMRMQQAGNEVTVMTAMPNYPRMQVHEAYRGKWLMEEQMAGVRVVRSWIFVSRNRSFLYRLANYFSFVFSSMILGAWKLRKADVLMVESPPLFLGISAMFLSLVKRARLIVNISDLWPESAVKLGMVRNKYLISLSEYLEAKMYRRSVLVSGQTRGICRNIEQRFPGIRTYWWRNGIDLENFSEPPEQAHSREKYGFGAGDFVLLYAGILGLAQGLEIITEAACLLRDHREIKFFIVGEGPEKERLQAVKKEQQLENVIFHELVPRSEMAEVIACAEASLIPLKKLDLFLSAIPSKIFESLVMRKPLLLSVDGEARELFIDQGKCGLFVEPENAVDLAEKILYLKQNEEIRQQMADNAYQYVSTRFSREVIAREWMEELRIFAP